MEKPDPASLEPIMRPRSIAVLGASRSPNTIGHQILANLVQHGYTGAVYPVNPTAHAVGSIRAYPSISDVPEPVDLAILVVPKQHALRVAEECGEAGVKGLVVISAGFREIGGEGIERESQLVSIARRYGMRMIGPNCMGVLNSAPDMSMNATFAPKMPPFGRAAFVSQSGALGASVLDYAREFGIGMAQFVSIGNKADVSGNDLLGYWEHDDGVELILMYVENFGNPANFRAIASRVGRTKPIIIVTSGRSAAGARAASSHTGALAASNEAVDALLEQAGVIRAASIEELFDIAMGFTARPLPRTRRTVVLTNAGGPGILAADALATSGIEVGELEPSTIERLRPMFPEEASIRNPLDMIASADSAKYRAALEILLEDPGVASAVPIFVPPLGVRQQDVAEAIVAAAESHPDKAVLAVLMGRDGLPQGRAELNRVGIPAYVFPESAARALGALCRYRERRDRPLADPPVLDRIDLDGARSVLAAASGSGREKLGDIECFTLLERYGIDAAQPRLARNAEEAVRLAGSNDDRLVMKVVSPDIIHKSDIGGVAVGVASSSVASSYAAIIDAVRRAAPAAEIDGVLVQPMVTGGTELIVGLARDPAFGPLVMLGLGGVYVEALGDVVFRLAPLSRVDAEEMVDGFRGSRILRGMRGRPPADREAIIEVLLRVSRMAVDNPEIVELDINPLIARPDGAIAVDVRVTLERAERGAD
jgi:acetyl coenzyme A synthetase (ADP forming)-like protein